MYSLAVNQKLQSHINSFVQSIVDDIHCREFLPETIPAAVHLTTTDIN